MDALCTKSIAGVTCWQTYIKFAEAYVAKMVAEFGLRQGSGKTKGGIKVSILAFACADSQSTPITINVLPQLSGNVNQISNAFKALKAMVPVGGTCPDEAMFQFIKSVEASWPESAVKKVMLIETDGLLYNLKAISNGPARASAALEERCVDIFTVSASLFGAGLSPQQRAAQLNRLKTLTNGSPEAIFDIFALGPALAQAVDSIYATVQAHVLKFVSKNKATLERCNAPTLPVKPFCGYTKSLCLASAPTCKWNSPICKSA